MNWASAELRQPRGNITLMTALAVLPLSLVLVGAVELTALSNERAMMQAAADAAALAGAQSRTIAGTNQKSAAEFAEKFALSQVGSFANRARVRFVASDGANGAFTVQGFAIRPSFFGNMVPPGGFRIAVQSVAEALVKQPLCILGIEPTPGTFTISSAGSSKITAKGCVVHSNSDHEVKQLASIDAGTVRMTGTASGAAFSPLPQTGALAIPDPFKDRTITSPTPCANVPNGGLQAYSAGTITLNPGVHRTQYAMSGTATLKLMPGEHYFCSDLNFSEDARLEGQDTVMVLMDVKLMVEGNTYVSLEGRTVGPWAGFVIVSNRSSTKHVSFKSTKIDRLLGTIYLPNTTIYVTAPGNVAQGSQWSVVVARYVITSNSSNLIINSNYDGSPVPVPEGVGNRAGGADSIPLRLRH
ncbi:pilus assembly protein TadG-related protein [Aquidulcibacter sp.]|uniref:pilus assembly protein TadG-related protein n=1 Tax=Aquidulcibacter sp. TaxID=2052990 RepID=UPI0025B9130E|nr:pilus assembly protein TadG-related protein [Aquidulcibacter sp.]